MSISAEKTGFILIVLLEYTIQIVLIKIIRKNI